MTLFVDLSDKELEKILLGDRGKDLLMRNYSIKFCTPR